MYFLGKRKASTSFPSPWLKKRKRSIEDSPQSRGSHNGEVEPNRVSPANVQRQASSEESRHVQYHFTGTNASGEGVVTVTTMRDSDFFVINDLKARQKMNSYVYDEGSLENESISMLVEYGFVIKDGSCIWLTEKGADLARRIDEFKAYHSCHPYQVFHFNDSRRFLLKKIHSIQEEILKFLLRTHCLTEDEILDYLPRNPRNSRNHLKTLCAAGCIETFEDKWRLTPLGRTVLLYCVSSRYAPFLPREISPSQEVRSSIDDIASNDESFWSISPAVENYHEERSLTNGATSVGEVGHESDDVVIVESPSDIEYDSHDGNCSHMSIQPQRYSDEVSRPTEAHNMATMQDGNQERLTQEFAAHLWRMIGQSGVNILCYRTASLNFLNGVVETPERLATEVEHARFFYKDRRLQKREYAIKANELPDLQRAEREMVRKKYDAEKLDIYTAGLGLFTEQLYEKITNVKEDIDAKRHELIAVRGLSPYGIPQILISKDDRKVNGDSTKKRNTAHSKALRAYETYTEALRTRENIMQFI